MTRVLHIFNSLNHSGAEVMIAGAAKHFNLQGYETYALATGKEAGSYTQCMRDAGVKVFHKELQSIPSHLLYVYQLIRNENIEVLHIHTERRHYYLWLSLLARVLGKRCVRTLHAKFHSRSCFRLKVRCLVRCMARVFGCLYVSVSESVYQNEYELCGIKTRRINNWVDVDRFGFVSYKKKLQAKSSLGLKENSVTIMTVGNCSSVKNHDFFIRCIPRIVQRYPNLTYLHVGYEDPDFSERHLAKELGVDKYIQFLGSRDDVDSLLAASDLFVMPSLYEGVGVAAIEALASGVPSVFSDVSGLNTLKGYSPLASYFQLGDEVDLLEKIDIALDVEERDREKVSHMVRSRYATRRGVDEYVDVYSV